MVQIEVTDRDYYSITVKLTGLSAVNYDREIYWFCNDMFNNIVDCPGSSWARTIDGVSPSESETYTITGLSPGTQYTIRSVVWRRDHPTLEDDIVNDGLVLEGVYTLDPDEPPTTGNISLNNITSNSVTVTLTGFSDTLDGCELDIKFNNVSKYYVGFWEYSDHYTVEITDLIPDTNYNVEVSFYNPDTERTINIGSIEFQTLPPKIELLSVTENLVKIELTRTSNACNNYKLEILNSEHIFRVINNWSYEDPCILDFECPLFSTEYSGVYICLTSSNGRSYSSNSITFTTGPFDQSIEIKDITENSATIVFNGVDERDVLTGTVFKCYKNNELYYNVNWFPMNEWYIQGLEPGTEYTCRAEWRYDNGVIVAKTDSITFTTLDSEAFSFTYKGANLVNGVLVPVEGNEKETGFYFYLTANEWNNLCSKINQARSKHNLNQYDFVSVSSGDNFTYEIYNTVVSQLRFQNSNLQEVAQGDVISAGLLNILKDTLNAALGS